MIRETPVRPSDFFYQNPRNRAHVQNRSVPVEIATFESVWIEGTVTAILTGLLIGALYIAYPAFSWLIAVLAIAVIGGVPLFFVKRKNADFNARLVEQGAYCMGEVVTCAATVNRSGFYVTTTYSFVMPDGRRLTGKSTAKREDLNGKQLPLPGTRVYVLSFGKNEYYLL